VLCIGLVVYIWLLKIRGTRSCDVNVVDDTDTAYSVYTQSLLSDNDSSNGFCQVMSPTAARQIAKGETMHWTRYCALGIDMFCLSMFSPGVMLYFVGDDAISTPFGNVSSATFIYIYNTFGLAGALSGRMSAYHITIKPVWISLSVGLVGVTVNLARFLPVYVSFVGVFCIMFMNGFLYNQTWRYVHKNIMKCSRLKTLSKWLFCGDLGSVVGSNLINVMNVYLKK
jgi:hypothetical protein